MKFSTIKHIAIININKWMYEKSGSYGMNCEIIQQCTDK